MKADRGSRDVTILILENDPETARGLGRIFWEKGWDVAFSLNTKSFYRKMKIVSFDLVIVDLGIKELDFDSLCSAICGEAGGEELSFNTPPLLALVPEEIDFIPGKWLEHGLADYISGKPGNVSWDYYEIFARASYHLKFRKKEKELTENIRRLEESNKDKDNFYRILSHDLKAPFQGLVGLLEVLHGEYEELTEKEIRGYIRNIHDSTKRTYRLLENLLEWSGLQGGKLKWSPEEMELQTLVEDVISLFKIGARDKGIALDTDIPDGLIVFADRRLLSSVIRNLVYNGIKFTDRNGSVSVRARESVDYFEITVEDTGVGLHPDNINKLLRSGGADTTPGTAKETGSGLD